MKQELSAQVADAYEHLYDLVYLRTHPLLAIMQPDTELQRKELAWRLHHALIDLIEELNPGVQAPTFSREWRRYRLMLFRYVDCLEPQEVASQLGISRRHYYRDLEAAITALSTIIAQRYGLFQTAEVKPEADEATADDQLDLLRSEALRAARTDRNIDLPTIVQGVLDLMASQFAQYRIVVHQDIPEDAPEIHSDSTVLRQMLLGMLNILAAPASQHELRIHLHCEQEQARLQIDCQPALPVESRSQIEQALQENWLQEMATLCGGELGVSQDGQATFVWLQLSIQTHRTVLAIDDNADMLELMHRYLTPHGYQVVAAQHAEEALALAERLHPYAVTTDLMMPDHDGWDVLKTLRQNPATQHIPVIVCSVLRQRDLAFALGAAGYIEKPITEQKLLHILNDLKPLEA